jgi:predicted nucleic acid-binding protein
MKTAAERGGMALNGWIVDKSVASRMDNATITTQLLDADGPLYICEVGLLEQLYSAKNARDYDRLETLLRTNFEALNSPNDILASAQRLQRDLAHFRGLRHRRPIPDLLIAITAMHHDVGVVHADNDFDLISKVRPLKSWKLRNS